MLGAELVLLLTLQLPPDHKVALTFADRTEIARLVDAEREFAELDKLATRTDEQAKRHAALNLALGTLPDDRRIARCKSGHQPLCDTQRGVRRPVQRSER